MIEAYIYTAGCAAVHDYCWLAAGARENVIPDEVSSRDLQNTKASLTFHNRTATLFIGGMETSRTDFLKRSIYNHIAIICREFTKQEAAGLQKICASYLAGAQSFAKGLDSIVADNPDSERGFSVNEASLVDFLGLALKNLPDFNGTESLKKGACQDTPENRHALAAALSSMDGSYTAATQLLVCKYYSPQKYLVEPSWRLYDNIDAEAATVGEFAVKHKHKIGLAAAVAAAAAIVLPITLGRKKNTKKRGVAKHGTAGTRKFKKG